MKALGVDIHPFSVELYRSEAATMPHLPPGLPVPHLLDVYDDGKWVALMYEDVDGRHPALPWRSDDLERVARALADLGAALQPSPWPDAPGFAEANRTFVGAGRELAAAPDPDLDPWLWRRLERLAAEEIGVAGLFGGDALLHTDIRSDNLLITPDGEVVVLDWAGPCNGAPWLDLLLFAVTVNAEGGADPEQVVRRHPLTRDINPSWIDAVLLTTAANFWSLSRLPEDPALPGSRAYQRAYAEATLRWLQRRGDP
ncbi:MAG: aminoglycoside phosphotransferase family protein [Candidatus Dormibacteraeota bacterium]|nr:aminoglycoside phosphotransferase family protein [Candidatus Dormibacteraeota bacterium]